MPCTSQPPGILARDIEAGEGANPCVFGVMVVNTGGFGFVMGLVLETDWPAPFLAYRRCSIPTIHAAFLV